MSVIITEKQKPNKCEDCFAFCQTLNAEGSDWNCYCGIDRNTIFDKKGIRAFCPIKEVKAIPLDKVKKAREEIQKLRGCSCSCSDGIIDDVEDILDKLIESEDKE